MSPRLGTMGVGGFVIGTHQLGVPCSNGTDTKGGPGPRNPVTCTLLTPHGTVCVVHGEP